FHVHGHGYGAGVADRQPRSNEGVSGHKDFGARANPAGTKDEFQGLQPVADRDAVTHAEVRGEFNLESLNFAPEDEPAVLHDATVRLIQLALEFMVAGPYVEERNFHGFLPVARKNAS